MTHSTKCKLCGNPIDLAVDDSYADLGDPYKLFPLAVCNRCSDIRDDKARLEHQIHHLCLHLVSCRSKPSEVASSRNLMFELARKYTEVVARHYKLKQALWDDGFPEQLLAHPDQWSTIIGSYWRTVRSLNAQKSLL